MLSMCDVATGLLAGEGQKISSPNFIKMDKIFLMGKLIYNRLELSFKLGKIKKCPVALLDVLC